jgi:uncharacterized membrane protein HdeD (DUF308 family)
MLDTLTRYWWVVTVRGVSAVLFGLIALIWPSITVTVLVLLFGAYSLVDGVSTLASAAFGRPRATAANRIWLVLSGVAAIFVGVVTFFWPSATALVLLWLIAGWAVVTGVMELMAAIRLRKEIQGEWMLAVSGILSILFGVVLILWPEAGALTLILFIGGFAVVFGLALLALGVRLRRISRGTDAISGRPATV